MLISANPNEAARAGALGAGVCDLDEGQADLTEVLTRLCRVMTASSEIQYRGIRLELRAERPVLIDAARCWRARLVVAEIINNSFRHAFASSSGCIFAYVGESRDRFFFCNVIDDGASAQIGEAGLGTHIIDALAAKLDGLVERRFSKSGARVMLSFPKTAPVEISEYPLEQRSVRPARDLSPIVGANAKRL